MAGGLSRLRDSPVGASGGAPGSWHSQAVSLARSPRGAVPFLVGGVDARPTPEDHVALDSRPHLVDWTPEEVAGFGQRVLRLPHRLHERDDLIGDEALVSLLDRLPDRARHIYTMGTDPLDRTLWRQGGAGDRSGVELLGALRSGRLWFNLLRVQDHDAGWATALDDLVAGVRHGVPGLELIDASATLLVSSRTAQVHYHADAQPNLLLHCRGRKRVFVWPALDPRFVAHQQLARIFSGEADEWLAFDGSFDQHATVVDLDPGQALTWPQNSGHRVANTDGLNVSLSVEFATSTSLRRQHVWAANRYLSERFHLPVRSTREAGVWAASKVFCYRSLRTVRATPTKEHLVTFVVDPEAPLGVGPAPAGP